MKGQTGASEFAGEGLAEPGFDEFAAHLGCYTSRHCPLYLRIFLALFEDDVGGNVDGFAANVAYAVCVEGAGRVGSADSFAENLTEHVKCDGSVGVVCKGPLFHNEQQSRGSHVVVDENG